MNENLTKICRICLTEGSRHIFQKTVAHDALYNVSSLNRISEKLRYVTLLKIDEIENLPPMICDLCIVQLNVAYNFKRQATESDTKLRQYLIENGIDIMKDVRSLPAIRPADQPSAPVRTLSVPNRTNHRLNSASSASVFEVPTNRIGAASTNLRPFEPRLIPIRIKVETPETVEQSSEPGDLLSASTISPLSTGAIPVVTVPSTSMVTAKTTSSENIVIESSPGSSKGSLSSNGRDSAMVVVNSQNISLQGDEDYVQTILGSNSSLAINASKSVEKHDASTEKSTKKTNAEPQKHKQHSSPDHQDSPKERRLQNLLTSLRINMVTNARFPQSKLRIKPRKKLQKQKQKQQIHLNPTPKPKKAPTQPPPPKKIARRHSMDLAQLLNGTRIKKEQNPKKSSDKKSPGKKQHVISPRKLFSLRDMIREERVRQKETSSSKKQTETASKPAGGQKVHDDRTKTTVS
ncbi:uncharacterized protein LOC135708578 [Ochlerotatus camptorhynchus]|uniref:uncharacterized protein LOC135708578 n=1 Tax=Ochlerotatus camptorhynchus TaxID=644619 RepID=UPI0031D8C0E0